MGPLPWTLRTEFSPLQHLAHCAANSCLLVCLPPPDYRCQGGRNHSCLYSVTSQHPTECLAYTTSCRNKQTKKQTKISVDETNGLITGGTVESGDRGQAQRRLKEEAKRGRGGLRAQQGVSVPLHICPAVGWEHEQTQGQQQGLWAIQRQAVYCAVCRCAHSTLRGAQGPWRDSYLSNIWRCQHWERVLVVLVCIGGWWCNGRPQRNSTMLVTGLTNK